MPPRTRGHGDPATKFPPAENSSLAPGRKKNLFISPRTSCAPAIPGRSLTPQSDHAPLFEYIDAPSGPSESSHTCRSWQRAVGPNVCILREAGLDARANAVASSPTLPFGLPQAIATRRLRCLEPWKSLGQLFGYSVTEWRKFQSMKSQVRHATAGRGERKRGLPPPRVLVMAFW